MPKKLQYLIFAVGVCLGTGLVGSYFTASAIPTWYSTLEKPFFSPPNWIFAPVWSILYFLMGVSLYLVWINKSKARQAAVNLFFMQLGFNVVWSILFFGLQSPKLALFEIMALWMSIFLTIHYFHKVSRLASYLLVPYFLWVSFASILNLAIVWLN